MEDKQFWENFKVEMKDKLKAIYNSLKDFDVIEKIMLSILEQIRKEGSSKYENDNGSFKKYFDEIEKEIWLEFKNFKKESLDQVENLKNN